MQGESAAVRDIIIAIVAGLPATLAAVAALVKVLRDSKAKDEKYADLLKRFRLLGQEHQCINKAFEELTALLGETDRRADELAKEYALLKSAYEGLGHKYELLQANYNTLQALYTALVKEAEAMRNELELYRPKRAKKPDTGGLTQ